MEFEVKKNWYGTEVIITDNSGHLDIKIVEDIEERFYAKKEDGKIDFNKRIGVDIKDAAIEKYASLLEEIIDLRDKDYDLSSLIKRAFDLLPSKVADELVTELYKDFKYEEDGE